MQQVITEKQAREITGGRKPLVPVEYETAVNALQACLTIDEAKYWSDKADALAAWARIYRSPEAARKAKALRLHAYRRMAILAKELAAERPRGGKGRPGQPPGGLVVLKEHGLSRSQAAAALHVAKLPKKQFENYVEAERPPSPHSLTAVPVASQRSKAYQDLLSTFGGSWLSAGAAFAARHNARELALGLKPDEAEKIRPRVASVLEWLDAFEQALPKEASGK